MSKLEFSLLLHGFPTPTLGPLKKLLSSFYPKEKLVESRVGGCSVCALGLPTMLCKVGTSYEVADGLNEGSVLWLHMTRVVKSRKETDSGSLSSY